MSPCNAPALKPCFCSDLCSSATSRLRLQKMIAFLKSAALANEPAQRFALGGAGRRGDESLRDGRRGGGRARDLDAHGIMQKRLGEAGDFRRHGRREEQRLPREGHQLADALDVRDEAHVEHAVGFVDDENLDAGEQQLAALGEIEQAPWRRDQHVGAAHDLGFLVAEGDAADQQRDIELVVDAVARESSPRPGRRVRASARGSGCAACARGRGPVPAATAWAA